MKFVFFGTPAIAAGVLDKLCQAGLVPCAIVTQPDRPQGRLGSLVAPAVKQYALQALPAVPIFQPEKVSTEEYQQTLSAFDADLFVVVAYGEILRQMILDIPKKACINLHASLLPKYRGAAPIQRAIIDGELETGTTIIHMVRGMDAGAMIRQSKIAITPNMTAGELAVLMEKVGSSDLITVIRDFECGEPAAVEQDPLFITFAPKINPEDGLMAWSKSAQELHNLARGVTPKPGAYAQVLLRDEVKRLKIVGTSIESSNAIAGSIVEWGASGIVIGCGSSALRLHSVQLEGKKLMSAEQFAFGYPQKDIKFI